VPFVPSTLNRLRQIVEYAGNGVKTLELHGTEAWNDDLFKALLVDRHLMSPVFFENLVSLHLDDVTICAEELIDFLEGSVLLRPKEKRLEIKTRRPTLTTVKWGSPANSSSASPILSDTTPTVCSPSIST